MSIGTVFWILMILWFFSFIGQGWTGAPGWIGNASSWLLFVLIFLVGWHDFGFVIHQ